MADIIELYPKGDYVAWCPECRCTEWEILIDAIGDEWENITGTRCVDCGFVVDWIVCHRSHEGDDG